jgi:hypothetical protein
MSSKRKFCISSANLSMQLSHLLDWRFISLAPFCVFANPPCCTSRSLPGTSVLRLKTMIFLVSWGVSPSTSSASFYLREADSFNRTLKSSTYMLMRSGDSKVYMKLVLGLSCAYGSIKDTYLPIIPHEMDYR